MMAKHQDELDVLQAVYCAPGEFMLINEGDCPCFKVSTQDMTSHFNIEITFQLSSEYPNQVPHISIFCDTINRTQLSQLKHSCLDYANELKGDNMIMNVVQWLQENTDFLINEHPQKDNPDSDVKHDHDTDPINRTENDSISATNDIGACVRANDTESSNWTALLSLDHMRSKTKYIKTIKKWVDQLGLQGRLIFQGKLILILLQGHKESIKEYLTLQRTVNVDVDSKGRSCKEKMMKILHEEETKSPPSLCGFDSMELQTNSDLQDFFSKANLGHIFKSHF
ncbi:unnamed protein product [Owenia fusiformis]|uniref:RWD domain-containing protein 3 n=1 Tax=Owenia fusiformis TaxID=6347 RepID=A0A8S4N5T0_OWEFU|nr:unnamed protein product [Owenia fusiformis]